MNIYTFDDYKDFISQALDTSTTKGARSALAKHLKCQSGFVSQVLNGDRHFSLEHVLEAADFFELDSDEANYLLLMTQKGRAGSVKLEEHYNSEMNKMRLARQRIPLKDSSVSEADLAAFHSHWYNYAIYEIVREIKMSSATEIAETLGISVEKTREALESLVQMGFIEENDKGFKAHDMNFSVGRGKPYVDLIHRNFRQEAIRSLDRRKIEDAHYSRFFVCDLEESAKLQEAIAEFVKSLGSDLQSRSRSKQSKLFSFCVDCFRYGD